MPSNNALLTDAFSSLRMRCGKTRTLERIERVPALNAK